MANPRKFSEKIALLEQKQAEGKAAFDQIMQEVSDVTKRPDDPLSSGGYMYGNVPGSGAPTQSRGRTAQTRVGPIKRPPERRIDTSPYGSTNYLSPPLDSSVRRSNSDSALHQSSVQQGHGGPGSAGTSSPHHQHLAQHQPCLPLHHHHHHHHRDIQAMTSMVELNPNRPRSSSRCEAPRPPGIYIYPSAHESGVQQIPVSSHNGSLPDLTSVSHAVHFPHNPHQDPDAFDPSGSPYSTSPISTSPATLSPTSVLPMRGGQSPNSNSGSPTTSLHHYTDHQAWMYNRPLKHPNYAVNNHLSVPNSNRYLHQNSPKGQGVEWVAPSYQQQCSPPSHHSSHSNININIPSPTMGVSPIAVGGSNGGYRSPRSPGSSSSPGGAGGGGGGGGDSPHHHLPAEHHHDYQQQDNTYYIKTLEHFNQISMEDTPDVGLNFVNNNQSHHTYSQATLPGSEGAGGGGGWTGGGGHQHTPNTPSNIPNIILTDFSNPNNSSSELNRDLSASIGGQFDTSFFADDEGLRDGLDPIDLDGLQMLADSSIVISDPITEEGFRLDRS